VQTVAEPLSVLPTASIPESHPVVIDEMLLDYKAWPRRRMFIDQPCQRRLQILQEVFKAMSKKVYPRQSKIQYRPCGLYYTWHYQVYLFLKLQLKQEREALKGPDVFTRVQTLLIPRKKLAEKVAHGGGWGRRVQERIMAHEVLWVTKRIIPQPGRGRHKKVVSLLEDPNTVLAVREYILKAGDSKFLLPILQFDNFGAREELICLYTELNARNLAKAVARYWRLSESEDTDITNRSLNSVAREVEKTISTPTASRWLRKLGFKYKEYRKRIYNDGHEREDVKHYRDNVFLPRMESLKDSFLNWDENLQEIPNFHHLSGEVQPVILVTQDECTFNSNDGKH